jgi:hypothetical protein
MTRPPIVSWPRIDRRTVVGIALAALTSACAGGPSLPALTSPATKRLGDAHVHLFNAADLPVRGFLDFVVIPQYLAHIPEVALALVDAAGTVLKAMSPTASAEFSRRPRDASPRDFADRLAGRIEVSTRTTGIGARALAPGENVAHSYAVLGALLRAADPASAHIRPEAVPGNGEQIVDHEFLARIAVQGRNAARPDVGVRAAMPATARIEIGAPTAAKASDDLGALWDSIKWCYEMIVSRSRHVHDYLSTIADADRPTDVIINLLVDYDAWLGDTPSDGSSMHDQLLFWDGFAASVADRLEIHTFAGYDPLRHAEDRLANAGASDYWRLLQDAATMPTAPARRLAAGFKIYPPMGFRVSGNAGNAPAGDRSGLLVQQRWNAHRWSLDTFGAELDASLDLFFAFCADKRVPIVAHGRHSQEASTGTGAFASPRYWFERAQRVFAHGEKPLRASIAHWTIDSEFREWAPRILALNEREQAEIYFDVAYTPEFLPGGDGAAFMAQLTEIYMSGDQSGRWLMFGSDWIMLGREPGAEHYARRAIAAIRSVKFWSDREDLVLHDNLRRFLGKAA